ncbi:MAG: hypothetical protein K6T83_01920 [Alicyclobacillus sp.]|nr:hypothetical protein [Alicyclobacillus sp.]
MHNVALVGFPASGKSTIAPHLSKVLRWELFDIHHEVVKRIGMPISEYWLTHGEDAFRKIVG